MSKLEVAEIVQKWGLNFSLGIVLEKIKNSGKTYSTKDLKEALDYLEHEIKRREDVNGDITLEALKVGLAAKRAFEKLNITTLKKLVETDPKKIEAITHCGPGTTHQISRELEHIGLAFKYDTE